MTYDSGWHPMNWEFGERSDAWRIAANAPYEAPTALRLTYADGVARIAFRYAGGGEVERVSSHSANPSVRPAKGSNSHRLLWAEQPCTPDVVAQVWLDIARLSSEQIAAQVLESLRRRESLPPSYQNNKLLTSVTSMTAFRDTIRSRAVALAR